MKRLIAMLCACLITTVLFCSCIGEKRLSLENGNLLNQFEPSLNGDPDLTDSTENNGQMTAIEKEYNSFINDLSNFPVNFIYDNSYYAGFSPRYFKEQERVVVSDAKRISTTIYLQADENLKIRIESALYPKYNAYDYAVYFENYGKENTGIIRQINSVDMKFQGEEPRLKGILGDYDNHYGAYDKDLTKENVNFVNLRGRPTHTTFPYFNLETEHGGAMLAIGWGGTWKADFVYDATTRETHFTGTGTVGMNTYLQPGETVRTPLIGVVRYYERDEDVATNAWRRWLVDCVYPRDHAGTDECAQPISTVYHAFDTDNPARFETDGSTAEDYRYWQPSVKKAYQEGLIYDVQWFDAGWYTDPYGKTVEKDWWGTVGTWELDTVKWPDNTFKERIDYAHENGQKFLVWFEPERVTHLDGLVANYGYDRSWALSDHGNNNSYINNLGNKDCLEWTVKRILDFMEKYDVDMYREDFNIDPGIFWTIGDGYQGSDRTGITENLYIQGHYALFDAILDWAAKNGKPTFLDSCASGGGRNDLETLRRAIHLNRSDSDRFTTVYRLSLTPRVNKWLPYNGTIAKEAVSLTDNSCDIYALRASYMCVYTPAANFYLDGDTIDFDMYRQGLAEFNEIKKYLLKDFYSLTPYRGIADDTNWTAFMYFDPESDSGVIQAFRQTLCEEKSITVNVKGVSANKYYSIRDIDGNLSIARIKGSALQNGLRLQAKNARTAITLYIEPCK